MGLLTRGGNLLSDLGRQVPAGSTRDRLINSLAGGIEGTQNLLAGKYGQAVTKALSSTNTAAYAPLAYGLIGAGGSVVGNAISGEEKDPGRILAEAAGAGGLGALAGRYIGKRGAASQLGQANYLDVAEGYGEKAMPYVTRAAMASEAGASSTAQAAAQQAAAYGNKILEAKGKQDQLLAENRLRQGATMLAMPAIAGLGGMMGGQVSDVGSAIGFTGPLPETPIDPERPGSSNTLAARNMQPTMQYV